MHNRKHKVHPPFKDEDRWFNLTKRQIAILIILAVLIIGVLWLTYKLSILPVGISISIILIILAYVIVGNEIPKDKYLFGSGNRIEKILWRWIKKRLPWKKKVYVKNLDNGFERWKGR